MRVRRLAAAATTVVIAALVGCAPARKPVTVDFEATEDELRPFRAVGDAVLTGQAFLRQQGGGVVTCAGETVILAPDLPPIRRGVELAKAGYQVQGSAIGGNWGGSARQTTCDAQGNFRFDKLPAAGWYVVTRVQWVVADEKQGGELAHPVKTSAGETAQILLTDDDRI